MTSTGSAGLPCRSSRSTANGSWWFSWSFDYVDQRRARSWTVPRSLLVGVLQQLHLHLELARGAIMSTIVSTALTLLPSSAPRCSRTVASAGRSRRSSARNRPSSPRVSCASGGLTSLSADDRDGRWSADRSARSTRCRRRRSRPRCSAALRSARRRRARAGRCASAARRWRSPAGAGAGVRLGAVRRLHREPACALASRRRGRGRSAASGPARSRRPASIRPRTRASARRRRDRHGAERLQLRRESRWSTLARLLATRRLLLQAVLGAGHGDVDQAVHDS